MTEKEKMLAGELYTAFVPELMEGLARAKRLCEEYNKTPRDDAEKRRAIMHELLGRHGERFISESNVWFDYGYNTEVGEDFYVNHDCVFLDCNKITFGNNVFIAPQCGFYASGHPLDAAIRREEREFALPITVGNDVWFGGGVKVLPGVTIGDNVVIGAGSVVSRDIPSNSMAVGVPARVVKTLPALDDEKGSPKKA